MFSGSTGVELSIPGQSSHMDFVYGVAGHLGDLLHLSDHDAFGFNLALCEACAVAITYLSPGKGRLNITFQWREGEVSTRIDGKRPAKTGSSTTPKQLSKEDIEDSLPLCRKHMDSTQIETPSRNRVILSFTFNSRSDARKEQEVTEEPDLVPV